MRIDRLAAQLLQNAADRGPVVEQLGALRIGVEQQLRVLDVGDFPGDRIELVFVLLGLLLEEFVARVAEHLRVLFLIELDQRAQGEHRNIMVRVAIADLDDIGQLDRRRLEIAQEAFCRCFRRRAFRGEPAAAARIELAGADLVDHRLDQVAAGQDLDFRIDDFLLGRRRHRGDRLGRIGAHLELAAAFDQQPGRRLVIGRQRVGPADHQD